MTMRITEIIWEMTDIDYEKLQDAWYGMVFGSGNARKNARRRLLRLCKKYSLSEADVDWWMEW